MNVTDKIITALTPGSIFNRNGLIFRSLGSLAAFAKLEEAEVLELLNGDLVDLVTCKPSARGKGILVALTAVIELHAEVDENPVDVVVEPVNPDLPIPVAAMAEFGAIPEHAPIEDAE